METDVRVRIVLVASPAGVDFGVQEGKGSNYTTIQKQRSKGADLSFEFTVTVKDNRDDGLPNFFGPLARGRRQIDSSTSTSENSPDSLTHAGSGPESRFP